VTGRPLDGVVVVAMEQAVAVPFATRQLADLGARVIKIERPVTGDFARSYDETVGGLSSAFVWLNRGKESIELDVKTTEGRGVLNALMARADVFLHNVSPAAARRLGVDSVTLSGAHPRLISGAVSGYGAVGPKASSKAYDLLVQGETGIISLNGTEDQPAKVGISIADIAAGMYTYASVLAALRHRDRTGEALTVDVSLFDSLTEWLGYPLLYTMHGGEAPGRMGTNHATIAPYGAFDTADGEQVLLAVQNNREWVRFCEHVLREPALAGDPRFSDPARRLRHRTELDAVINDCLRALNREAVVSRLEEASIANSRLNSILDLPKHEQLLAGERWIETTTAAGPVHTLLPPWVPDGHGRDYGPIPTLGQHTRQILEWLDLAPATEDLADRCS
jgi:formyl-CoA transferase